MLSFYVAKSHIAKSEASSYLGKKTLLVRMKDAIRYGDVEKSFEDVFQKPVVFFQK